MQRVKTISFFPRVCIHIYLCALCSDFKQCLNVAPNTPCIVYVNLWRKTHFVTPAKYNMYVHTLEDGH